MALLGWALLAHPYGMVLTADLGSDLPLFQLHPASKILKSYNHGKNFIFHINQLLDIRIANTLYHHQQSASAPNLEYYLIPIFVTTFVL